MNAHPLTVRPANMANGTVPVLRRFRRRLSQKEVASFIRNLAVLTDTHVPVADALQSLQNGSKRRRLAPTVEVILDQVTRGISLADSFALFPNIFPNHFVELTRVGEETGRLSEILLRLAERDERQLRLRRQIRSALAYPTLVLVVTVTCTIFLLIVIVPRFADLYAGFGATLPTPTAAVVTVSEWITRFWALLAGGMFVVGLFSQRIYHGKRGKTLVHRTLLRIPVLGTVLLSAQVSSFTQTLSLLLASGVSVDIAITLARRCLSNEYFQARLVSVSHDIQVGSSITSSLDVTGVFPDFAIGMLSAGETGGELTTALDHVGRYYASEVETISETLASMVEPLLIILVGVILGGLLSALYLPLFDIVNVIQ